jgi:hypothetical protein
MAWRQQSVAQPGQFLSAETVSGFNIDLFGQVSNQELAARVQQYVTGAVVISADLKRDLLTGTVRILAQAQQPVDTAQFSGQVEAALNSFWTIAGVRVNVLVGDDLSAPPPAGGSDIQTTVRWIAIAIIGVVILAAISQVRSVTK